MPPVHAFTGRLLSSLKLGSCGIGARAHRRRGRGSRLVGRVLLIRQTSLAGCLPVLDGHRGKHAVCARIHWVSAEQ